MTGCLEQVLVPAFWNGNTEKENVREGEERLSEIIDFEPTEEQFGVFWKYLCEETVTGVSYNGRELWVTDLKKGRYKVKEEVTEKFLTQFAHTIANCVNRQFNSVDNVLEADTRELRISILHESVAKSGMSICIRKSPPMVRNTIVSMIKSGYCSEKMLHLLINCVFARMNFVFGGEPGAGKTEAVKFFMQFISAAQRVITIEDSLELHYGEINPEHDYVELQVGEGFGYRDAIKACLRQDPEWLVLSEARSSEVTALLEQWSTGVCGFTTIHLDDLRKLPDRVLNMTNDSKDAERMENRIYSDVSVGVLVRMRKDKDGSIQRYIDQLCFYSREGEENVIYMIVEDGKMVSEEIPPEIEKKFHRAGIKDPFFCEKMEEFKKCGK